MASINGISIKGIKKFLGHEGEPLFQGNLYLNNKKIAYWSQDSHGGPDNFVFDKGSKQEIALNEIIKAMYPEKAYHGGTPDKPFVLEYDLEQLITDYLDLMNDEKLFKKAVKAGYSGVMVATDGYHEVVWNLPSTYTALSDEILLNDLKDGLDKAKKTFFPEDEFRKHSVKIYRSLDDFIVGQPIKFDDKSLDNLLSNAADRASQTISGKDNAEVHKNDINLS